MNDILEKENITGKLCIDVKILPNKVIQNCNLKCSCLHLDFPNDK